MPEHQITDSERLDFVARFCGRQAEMILENGYTETCNAWVIASAGRDLREAIDALMAGEKAPKLLN